MRVESTTDRERAPGAQHRVVAPPLTSDVPGTQIRPVAPTVDAACDSTKGYSALRLVPTSLKEANEFVSQHHRHHKPCVGHKFSIAIADNEVRGVAIVGRPVSRMADDGWTLEVNRCCTDGVKNGCSMLYGAAWRAAKAMGFKRLITYTLPNEGGTSLRAAGWRLVGEAGGGQWTRESRPRVETEHAQKKWRWEAV